ncbi:MAG: hypothetical protein GY909_13020 [Oligoflexia bacterium]|nr:hypothetical protein [Oligoflexia bacterium]
MSEDFNLDQELQSRMDFALELVKLVGARVHKKWSTPGQIQTKSDGSWVTDLDQVIEHEIRSQILKKFSTDGIIGEEFPQLNKMGKFTWTVDPIDGTSSLVAGVPLFGTIIGVIYQDEPVIGVIHIPLLEETVYARKGKGCWWKPSFSPQLIKVGVKETAMLTNATFSYSAPEYFKRDRSQYILKKIRKAVPYERMWGDCYGHLLVATGRLDIMVDPVLKIWDFVPLEVIIIEAGGVFHCFKGKSGLEKESGISTNSHLLKELLTIIK